jgi:hypothetical protein
MAHSDASGGTGHNLTRFAAHQKGHDGAHMDGTTVHSSRAIMSHCEASSWPSRQNAAPATAADRTARSFAVRLSSSS